MNTLRNYIFWKYERGSVHYDVLVTLILLFLFVTPRFVDFKDKPVTAIPLRTSEVLVRSAGAAGSYQRFVYQIRLDDLQGAAGDAKLSDADLRAAILRVVEPMAGPVTVEKYAPVVDTKGHIVAYDATVLR